MSDIRVASRYATSLVALAQEKGVLDNVSADMKGFAQTVEQNKQLSSVLSNPIINGDKKLNILKALFQGKVNPLTFSIFEITVRKKRESALLAVANEFTRQYNQIRNIQNAQVVTPFALTDDMRKAFVSLVESHTGKKAELTEKVNPNLIGGYVLTIGDTQIDNSLKSKLDNLKLKLIDQSYIPKY